MRKDTLLKHMKNTCKAKKDKEINMAELQKMQCDDDQQVKISFIEEKGAKINLEEMMNENEVNNPLNEVNNPPCLSERAFLPDEPVSIPKQTPLDVSAASSESRFLSIVTIASDDKYLIIST